MRLVKIGCFLTVFCKEFAEKRSVTRLQTDLSKVFGYWGRKYVLSLAFLCERFLCLRRYKFLSLGKEKGLPFLTDLYKNCNLEGLTHFNICILLNYNQLDIIGRYLSVTRQALLGNSYAHGHIFAVAKNF